MNTTPVGGDIARAPLSAPSAAALHMVQTRLFRATSSALVERYERAADEILRHPERLDLPEKTVLRASSNARKVVRHRRRTVVPFALSLHDRAAASDGAALMLELQDWIDASVALSGRDRLILHALLEGAEAPDIASLLQVSLPRARVIISRTRHRARSLWQNA